jgi:hypothetical protein
MGLFNTLKPTKALTQLLEKEHDAIIKAKFSTLPKISASKVILMQSVARSSATPHDLEVLKKLMDRNRILLLAAARGLQSARKHLSMLRAPKPTLQTYGPNGVVSDISNKSLTIKKKI